MCISGVMLQWVGLLILCVKQNMYFALIGCGLCVGCGVASVSAHGLIALNTYFRQKLGLVTGACFFGSGTGSLFLPYLLDFLLAEFDTRGALLLLSAVMSHSLIGCMLLRPASNYERIGPSAGRPRDRLTSGRTKYNKHGVVWEIDEQMTVGRYSARNPGFSSVDERCKGYRVQDKSNFNGGEVKVKKSIPVDKISVGDNIRMSEASSRGTTQRVELHLSAATLSCEDERLTGRQAASSSTLHVPATYKADIVRICSLRTFPVFVLGKVLSFNGFLLATAFLAPYASSEGMSSSEVATLLMISGLANMIGRPIHGGITSLERVDSNCYLGSLYLIGPVVAAISMMFSSRNTTYIIGTITGFVLASITSLINVTTVDCVGDKLFHRALTFIFSVSSIAYLMWPLLFGWIYDNYGSYRVPMAISLGLSFLGGLFTLLEWVIRRFTK